MPKSKQESLKKHVGRAYADLERAGNHMVAIHNAFKEAHSDYADLAAAIVNSIIVTQSLIRRFWEHAWGAFPKDIEQWRNR